MKDKYIEDLKEIKDIMNRSSRFITLSGLSGVFAGVVALAGVYLAYLKIFKGNDYLVDHSVALNQETVILLLLIAISTLVSAIIGALFFTSQQSKKLKQHVWDQQTKRLLINLSIPLVTGGLISLALIFKGHIGLVVPLSMVFYGLALVNGSKYTLHEIRSLGILEIILGLIGICFIESSLVLWAMGFGILHIVYGFFVQWKYKK